MTDSISIKTVIANLRIRPYMYSNIQKCIINFSGKKNIHLPPLTQTICIATEKYIPETIIFLFKSILFLLLLQGATLHTRATIRLFRPCKYSSEKNVKYKNDKFTLFNGHSHYHILCLYAVIWKYRYQTFV